MLKTEFNATVDATNGDTMLHPVTAHIGNTILVCSGGVVGPTDKRLHGKEVVSISSPKMGASKICCD